MFECTHTSLYLFFFSEPHSSRQLQLQFRKRNNLLRKRNKLPHGGGKRKYLPKESIRILEEWYKERECYPYLILSSDIKDLSHRSKLTAQKVKKWLANKRSRNNNTLSTNGGIHPARRKKMVDDELKKTNPEAAKRNKTPRVTHTPKAIQILNKYYNKHISFPYPSENKKRKLSEQTNMTVQQVSSWFSNARSRRRHTRPKKKNRQSESDVEAVTNRIHDIVIDNETDSDDESDSDSLETGSSE